jgi:hypothetical protein
MGHHQTRVNLTSTKISKMAIAKIQRQLVEIKVTQLLNVIIPTTGMEITLAPNTN